MKDINKSKTELLAEIQDLRDRLTASEEILRAIQQGEVDALVVSTHEGEKIFTLQSADYSYRLLVEEMQQGAAILSLEGLILYCNKSFARIAQQPLEKLIGSYFQPLLSPQNIPLFEELVEQAKRGKQNPLEPFAIAHENVEVPVYISITHLDIETTPINCLVITDLTEKKQHEKILALEKLARLILEQAGEVILVCDETGQVIRASDISSQFWGENLLFQFFNTLCPLYFFESNLSSPASQEAPFSRDNDRPDPRRKVAFSIASVLQGEHYQGLEVEFERQDGQVFNFVLNARPLADRDNHFKGAIVILTDITQRKKAEEELRQSKAYLEIRVAERTAELNQRNADLKRSEAALRKAQKLAHIGSWELDIATQKFIWSDELFRLFGLSPSHPEPTYAESFNYIHPEDRQRLQQCFENAMIHGIPYTIDMRVLRADGSTCYIEARGEAVRDDRGQIIRLIGTKLDISDRKRAEEAKEQQARQEKLLFSITQAIRQSLDLNAILNTTVTEVRQTLQAERAVIYRFNPDWSGDLIVESVAQGWLKLGKPEIQKVWEDTYLQATQGGRFRNHETFVVADIYAVGLESCHIELLEQFQARAYAIAPIFSGEALWGLLAIYQNATPRQWQSWEIELLQQITSQLAIAIYQSELYGQLQIELHERKQTEATLREAERRWRFLLDNVQLVVVGLDLIGDVNYVNPFFLKLTGYTESEVFGKNWFDIFMPPGDRPENLTDFSENLTFITHPSYKSFILTKTGEERFISWNNTLLRDANGNIIGTIAIGEDTTERQKIDRIKNEFIGMISHELRTPLTAIRASLGLMQSGVLDNKPEKLNRMFEMALINSERLVHLVNDILDIERLESGRATIEKTSCKAFDLMQQAVEGVQAIADDQHITLTIHPTDLKVWAASDAIIQTISNLLSNAIKFSPPGSTITLASKSQDNHVLFQVSDQGQGIPEDKLEFIFERFQQVDASDSRKKGGTGLGLAICRSIIQQHGGKIWAESTLGVGSTFFFTLPPL